MQSIDIKNVLSESWSIYKRHFWAISFIYFAVFIILAFARQMSVSAFVLPAEYLPVFRILSFFVQVLLSMGVLYMVLKIDRQRAPELNDFFAKIDRFFSFSVLILIMSALFYLGLNYMLIPAFMVLLFFAFAPYAFLDRNLGPLKSLLYSFKIGLGHWYKLTLFWFFILTVNILASFLLLPIIVAIPFSSIAVAKLYISLSCLYEKAQDCTVKLSPTLRYHKFSAILFLFALAFYGSSIYFNLLFNNQNSQKESATQERARVDTSTLEEYEDIKLVISFYKEEKGRCPGKSEIEQALSKVINWNAFEYTIDRDLQNCKICLNKEGKCENL